MRVKQGPPSIQYLAMFTAVVLCLTCSLSYFWDRYTLFGESQKKIHSLPYVFYIVDSWDREYSLGGIITFRAERMAPFVKDGSIVVKNVAAVSGDHIVSESGELTRNGENIARITSIQAKKAGKELKELDRNFIVPESSIFVLGTHERSYDSRYFGLVYERQLNGRAYPLVPEWVIFW